MFKPTFDEVYEKERCVEQLQAQLKQARAEFHDTACAYVGVSKGDVVRLDDGKVLKVTDVTVWSWQLGRICIMGCPQNKDGTWSKRRRSGCSNRWEKVE